MRKLCHLLSRTDFSYDGFITSLPLTLTPFKKKEAPPSNMHDSLKSKFYGRYYDLISKFQIGLKSLLCQGLSEPEFYGDLVYKLKKIVDSNNF